MPPFKVLRFLKQLYFSGFSYVFHESFLHRHLHYHASARLLVVRFPLVVCLFCQCLPVCLFVYPIRPPPPSCCRSRPQGLVVAGSPFDAQGCLLPASLPGIQEGHSGRPLADDAPGLSAGVSAAAASLSSPCSLPCPRRGLGGGCGVRGGVPRHEALQGHRKAGGEPCDLRAGCAGRVQARPWHFGALAPNPQSAQIHCK